MRRTIIKWAIWSLFGILFLVFLIRVAVFEKDYYTQMEGSERDTTGQEVIAEQPELIEVEPTEAEVIEYTVPADHPRYLSIDKLGISNARILSMGINSAGELDTPSNIFDTGWYNGSGKPGQGGTLIIDGHNGGPHVYGVFKRLPDLESGDIITVERGDGLVYKYSIVENKEIPLSDSNSYMSVAAKSPEKGRESVTLITCSGEWSQQQRTYLSRQFVRAVLVNN